MTKRDVVFMWDDSIPQYTYCPNACHPMKPLRLQLLYSLLESLDVLKYMRIVKPPPIEQAQMEAYHASEYLHFLQKEGRSMRINTESAKAENSTAQSDAPFQLDTLQDLANVTVQPSDSESVQTKAQNAMATLKEAIHNVRVESFLEEAQPSESKSGQKGSSPRDAPLKRVKTPKRQQGDASPKKTDDENVSGGDNAEARDPSSFFQLSSDCPAFEGMYDYSAHVAAGSVAGAVLLNAGAARTVIHWAGGLHHAHRFEAAGFCYVNDIVLAIIELMKVHQRVLYIDIDVHHGDGVEEAFITSDRVLTVSFHRHGRDGFFPGTGDRADVGIGAGEGYALNVPLYDGVNDEQFYWLLYKPIIQEALRQFRPDAIVMQCGADSIAGDRIGRFNLSSAGHARCLALVKQAKLPTLYLGGGGYTMASVARTWALETGMLCEAPNVHELSMIPPHAYDMYYSTVARERVLGVQADVTTPNENSSSYIDQVQRLSVAQLRGIGQKSVPE